MSETESNTKKELSTTEGNFAKPLNYALAWSNGEKVVTKQSGNKYRGEVELGKTLKATFFSDNAQPIKKLSGNSFRIFLYCICCRWPRLKKTDVNALNELRKKPYGSIGEIEKFFGISHKTAYNWITNFSKEVGGKAYLSDSKTAVWWIDAVKEKENGEGQNYLDWSFSMSFMEDYKSGVFPTNYPEGLIREKGLDDLALALSLLLTQYARMLWSNDGGIAQNSEMRLGIEQLFKRMNRPTAAPNRKDKEKLLRPFLKSIEALNESGFFGNEPYFYEPITKTRISLQGAKKDGTTWKDILKTELVLTLSFEPLRADTRAKALAYRKRAAESKASTPKGNTKKPPKKPKRWGGGITQAGAIDPDAPENGA